MPPLLLGDRPKNQAYSPKTGFVAINSSGIQSGYLSPSAMVTGQQKEFVIRRPLSYLLVGPRLQRKGSVAIALAVTMIHPL